MQPNVDQIDESFDEGLNDIPILHVRPRKNVGWYPACKRLFDVTFSLIALIVLSPVLLLLGLLIVLDDPKGGPVFSQIRCGRNGKPFRLYKFRTMVANAEQLLGSLQDQNEMEGPVFKIRNDPRITRVGRIIRKVSLDEFPQFINVLKGDMSIVGPRPPLPAEVAQYTEYQMRRLDILPGLTCLWQVSPDRNALSFDQWLELDLEYIRKRSFPLDMKIIFKTIIAMLTAQGQ